MVMSLLLATLVFLLPQDDPADVDTWGKVIPDPPEFFYASDVVPRVRELLEESILAAAGEWGNFGPLEYWVTGIDVKAAEELGDRYCSRRLAKGNLGHRQARETASEREIAQALNGCRKGHSFVNGLAEMAAKTAAAIEAGQPNLDASRNGMRDWNVHLLSSSYPVGFAGLFDIPFADNQTVAFHEYFHVVQHAHIDSFDYEERDELLGPMWWVEGGAEYMAQTTTQRLCDTGVLTASTWHPLAQRMQWKLDEVKRWINANPGLKVSEIPYGEEQNTGYSYGAWAHAYLSKKAGSMALLETFYPNLNDLGWEGSFTHTYGMTTEDFIAEFDQFLSLSIDKQLEVLGD